MAEYILIDGFRHEMHLGQFKLRSTYVTTRFYIPTDGRVWQAITDAEYALAQAEGRIRRVPEEVAA